jgi:hypothetical protein
MNFIHGEKTGYHFTEASERDGRRRTCVCVHPTAATGGRRRARAAATHGGVKCPDDAVDRPTAYGTFAGDEKLRRTAPFGLSMANAVVPLLTIKASSVTSLPIFDTIIAQNHR